MLLAFVGNTIGAFVFSGYADARLLLLLTKQQCNERGFRRRTATVIYTALEAHFAVDSGLRSAGESNREGTPRFRAGQRAGPPSPASGRPAPRTGGSGRRSSSPSIGDGLPSGHSGRQEALSVSGRCLDTGEPAMGLLGRFSPPEPERGDKRDGRVP